MDIHLIIFDDGHTVRVEGAYLSPQKANAICEEWNYPGDGPYYVDSCEIGDAPLHINKAVEVEALCDCPHEANWDCEYFESCNAYRVSETNFSQ